MIPLHMQVRQTSFMMLAQKRSAATPAANRVLDWSQLRAPVSVTFAVVFGMTLALLDAAYFSFTAIEIEAPAVIGSILLIMDKGTSESFYLATFYKTLCSIAGVSVGMTLSLMEAQIAAEYKDASNRRLIHEEDWKIMVFRVCVLVPIIFSGTLLIKRFKAMTYPILVFMVQIPSGVFAKSVLAAASSVVTNLVAIFIATVSIVVFDNISTEGVVMRTQGKVAEGVLSVMELALEADPDLSDEFDVSSDQVHKSISSLEISVAVNIEWRSVTCRHVPANHAALIYPLRTLFYQGFSLYWGNVQSYKAAEFSGKILFCNTPEAYENYFHPLVRSVSLAVSGIKLELKAFFNKNYFVQSDTVAMLERVLDDHLCNGLFLAQQHMRAAYTEYRDVCFSSFLQRCGITDYLRQLSLMTLALVDYLKAFSQIFLKDDDTVARLNGELDRIAEALDAMRKSETVSDSLFLHERVLSSDLPDLIVSATTLSPINKSPLSRAVTKGGL